MRNPIQRTVTDHEEVVEAITIIKRIIITDLRVRGHHNAIRMHLVAESRVLVNVGSALELVSIAHLFLQTTASIEIIDAVVAVLVPVLVLLPVVAVVVAVVAVVRAILAAAKANLVAQGAPIDGVRPHLPVFEIVGA